MNPGLDEVGKVALQRAQDYLTYVAAPRREPYSILRAIRFAAGLQDFCAEALISEQYETAGHQRRAQRSIFVPPAEIVRKLPRTGQRAPYESTVTGSGAELIATEFRGDLWIDALRPRSIALQLGAVPINGLVGDVQIPRLTGTSTGYWLTPGATSPAITESEATFDTPSPIKAVPCILGAYSTASRLLMQQTESNLADVIISTDLTRTLATALDSAIFQGTGTGGLPTGITNTAGVNAVSGTTFANATAITAAADVANANAIINRRALGWAAPSTVAALLMARMKVATYSYSPIWMGGIDAGTINDHPALSSNNLPAATAIFGDWSQVLVLTWGNAPIEVEANPYQTFATGDVAIRAMMSANVVVRHGPSFSVVSTIT